MRIARSQLLGSVGLFSSWSTGSTWSRDILRSVEKLLDVDPQGVGDFEEGAQRKILSTAFDVLDILDVDVAAFAEIPLGHLGPESQL